MTRIELHGFGPACVMAVLNDIRNVLASHSYVETDKIRFSIVDLTVLDFNGGFSAPFVKVFDPLERNWEIAALINREAGLEVDFIITKMQFL